MGDEEDITTLEGLLDRIDSENEDCDSITVERVVQAAGQRSFGPMLLVPGLIALSPLSGIPGMPTMVGMMVVLISGQLLIGRSQFWLPQFVLRRSLSRPRFEKAMKALRKVAGFVDRLLKPRLSFLVEGPATYVIAALSLLLAIAAPLLELLPFVITGVGAVLTCFGFGLLARDGALALLAFGFCIATGVIAGMAAS